MTAVIAHGPAGETPPAPLRQALKAFKAQGLDRALRALYQGLPATTCARQGACCGLLPPLAPLEIYAWLAWLDQAPPGERQEQVLALVEHFLLNAAQRRPCPWALAGACAVYEDRFWACRAYGLWPAAVYAPRRAAALAAQERVAQAWASLGVILPQEVLAPGPDYCGAVRLQPHGAKIPDLAAGLEAGETRLAELAQGLPWGQEVEACGGDLAYLLASLALGQAPCLEAKMEITRALTQGQTGRAQERLEACLHRATAWAQAWNKETP